MTVTLAPAMAVAVRARFEVVHAQSKALVKQPTSPHCKMLLTPDLHYF